MKTNRNSVNFLLDGATLGSLVALASTGLLLAYRLPPRMGRNSGTVLGLDRHQWGDVHFWISNVFLLLVAVHLCLHWRWIWAMARGKDPAKQKARGVAFLVLTMIIATGLALPWIIPVEVRAR